MPFHVTRYIIVRGKQVLLRRTTLDGLTAWEVFVNAKLLGYVLKRFSGNGWASVPPLEKGEKPMIVYDFQVREDAIWSLINKEDR